jgi:conjugal transfer pilus assembly protein TraE
MNPELSRNDNRDLKQLLLRQQAITFGLLGALVLLSLMLLRHQPKVILEPPTRVSTFTVQGDRVDENYLIEMAQYVAHMMLDVTPATIERRNDEVLKWVHPATFGAMQNRMAVAAKRLKEANATTIFWPTQVAPDPEHLRVAVIGSLETYVNGTRVQADRTQSWLLQFESKGGRMLIKDWKATPLDDPLLAKVVASQLENAGARDAN